MKDKKSASLFQKEQVMESLKQSFVKLNPRVMIKNPIMFTVELVTLVMLVVCILSLGTSEYGTFGYNFLVFVILFVTCGFFNYDWCYHLYQCIREKEGNWNTACHWSI